MIKPQTDQERFARLEEQVAALREDVREMRSDLKGLREISAESVGGLHVLHWLGLVAAAAGGWIARAISNSATG